MYFSSGPVPNDTIEGEGGKFEHEESTGDSCPRNIPWSDINNNSMDEKTSSAQSVGTTGAEKPNQSVEKVSSQIGCAGIDNGSFSAPNSSSSSMPQDAALLQISPQKGEAKNQNLSVDGQDVPSVQVSKCKYVQQVTMVKAINGNLF